MSKEDVTSFHIREAEEQIIPELSKIFRKRRWEAKSVEISLEFLLEDLRKQFPSQKKEETSV